MITIGVISAGSIVWWVGIGMALIIGGGLLRWCARDEREARFVAIEENLNELNNEVHELREKELDRARREILRRERRARQNDRRMILESAEQVDFYKSVMGDLDGL